MHQPPEQQPGPDPTEQAPQPDAPRIYVASLSDYNAGILHGVWLRADLDLNEINDGIGAMLAASPTTRRYGDTAEEWAIHDYENFGPVRLGEYEPLEHLAALAHGIIEHGHAFAAWWSSQEPDLDGDTSVEEQFGEQYQGEHASAEAYGEQLLDDYGINLDDVPGIPEGLRPYVAIDVAAWVRDMQYGGDITTVDSPNGIYVFNTS